MSTPLTTQQAVDLYTTMRKIRRFEETVKAHIGKEIVGPAHLYIGEEAVATGVCSNLTHHDYVTSTHRGHGHTLAKGARVDRSLAELYGRTTGYCKGKGGSMHLADFSVGMLGANGVVAGGFNFAAGAPLISLDHVTVEFGRGKNRFRAVDDVSLTINKGSIYGIIGFSGAGKSTLVRTMNVLQRPTSGTVTFNGTTISTLGEGRLLPLRRKIAMIFQHFNLMPSRTVLDNVTLPLIHEKVSRKDARAKAMHLLELVGIADKAKAYPRQLSGGQQQRVAIARALIGDPEVLLCDEATSALDPRTTRSILALLKDLNARLGLTIVLITHQMQVVKDICTDLAVMSHGKVVDDGSILDVFDHPSNELTREFIYTSGNMNKGITLVQEHPLFRKERESGSVYLLFSVGSGAEETLMADIRERFGVRGNIMFGNVDVIHGTPVGMILVSLDGLAEAVIKALAYFPTVGVSATPLADLHVNEVEENDNE